MTTVTTSGPAVSSRALGSLLDSWRASSAPGYAALADRVRLLVVDGRLPVGTRLPSERDLSAHLGVSRTTVAAAYASLRETGHVQSVRGSGSTVRLPARTSLPRASSSAGLLDLTKAALPAVDGIAEAAQRAAASIGGYLADSGYDTVGRPVLREAIAERYRARGLPTDAEQIVVTLGAQHAIALLARVLVGRGDRAVVEAPGYPHAFEALRGAGARLAPVSVTVRDGWDESALLQTLRRTSPTIAYLMPDFHNPTGATMPADQRVRVLEAAADEGTVVVADETMAELRIGGPLGGGPLGGGPLGGGSLGGGHRASPPLPMAAYGPAVLIGSAGKSLWGGLRIGWIRAERPLVDRLVRARSAGDLGTPVLEQLIVADLLGDMEGILEARAGQLRRGRDRVVAGLRSAFPGWQVPSPAGGLTTWVALGAPVSSQLTFAARQQGLLLAAGPMFGVDGAFERFLRVPFSYPDDETDRALAALAAAWEGIDGVQVPRGAVMAEVV
ncbi:PLP-dependent aminotransferase family protein [Frigoribacterium sp. CFBP 8754]|uniref:MocR-like transcription factor YczR n=1 Tax=Frigoribacterium sp. CFBP 8754 TaxID=2775290 RepID=UPI00177E457C|nr:PLP-dependent aminotransferase family protein [Frigoribacterium sp. CFBP 8754]MBD8661568.1 PLP-dependent aminotransferase family protein [Frigoribacterium sp. CFBP 8754]